VSPQKQDFTEILNHNYVYDKFKHRALHKSKLNIKSVDMMKQKGLPKVPTKASKLRDEHLKKFRDQLENSGYDQHKPEWKLKQFKGVGPSDNILESLRQKKNGKCFFVNKSDLPDSNNLPEIKDVQAENAYEKVDKKDKDKMMAEYYMQKRELSSKRSQA